MIFFAKCVSYKYSDITLCEAQFVLHMFNNYTGYNYVSTFILYV